MTTDRFRSLAACVAAAFTSMLLVAASASIGF